MALHSDASRCRPLGNTFLPLDDFSSEKADKHRRRTRAHSYSGYVPYRLNVNRIHENMSQGNPDEISCITGHNVLPPADEYEQLTMQRHVKDFSQYSAQTEVLINKEFVDEKAPGKSRSHCSKTEGTTSKLNENLFESDEHEQLEEYGLQKHGQTVYDHRDGAPQIFKQTAHTISEEGVLPTTNCLQDCNQSADQVQSSSPLGKRLVCLSEQLDTGDHNSLKSKCHVTKESTYRNVHHVSCLPDECSAGTSPSSS